MSNNRSIFVDNNHDISVKLKQYYDANPYGDRRYYGVTKVLSETKSAEDKASLQKWRDNVGEEKAESILQESLSIGNSLDMIIEKYLTGEPFNINTYKKMRFIFYRNTPVLYVKRFLYVREE